MALNLSGKKDCEKVWNAFKQMKSYLEKSLQVLVKVNDKNYYTNDKGIEMYDGVSALLNANIGHCNKDMISAIAGQLEVLDNTTMFTSTNNVSVKCSKKLCELTENHFYSTFFTNSGSEACDTAIKIVRKYWKNKGVDKKGIIALKGAYHGSGIGAMMLAHEGYEMDDFGLDYDSFYQINCPDDLEFEDCDKDKMTDQCILELRKLLEEEQGKIGALFMELIQLSNGVNVLPKEYVRQVREICSKEGILLVIDEVATGFGRTGIMFAYEHYGIKGDLMMLAKGITSGYFPMGCVLATEEVFKTFWGDECRGLELCHGYTTGGHPVGCAAAIENISIMEKTDVCANAEEMGRYLFEAIQSVCKNSRLVKKIRGKGLMISLIFKDEKIPGMQQWGIADIMSKFLANKGLLLYPDDPDTLIVAPPLNVKREECDLIVNKIAESIQKIEYIL